MTRLALQRRSTRPPRKDVDVPRRAVIAYLASVVGLPQEEIADYFNISQSRVSTIIAQSTCPCPPIYSWRH